MLLNLLTSLCAAMLPSSAAPPSASAPPMAATVSVAHPPNGSSNASRITSLIIAHPFRRLLERSALQLVSHYLFECREKSFTGLDGPIRIIGLGYISRAAVTA